MTTAYIIQIEYPTGVKYVGVNGQIKDVPKFFKSIPIVKQYSYRPRDQHLITIAAIPNLEAGLQKTSNVRFVSRDEFIRSTKSGPGVKKMLNNPDAVYCLREEPALLDSEGQSDAEFVSFYKSRTGPKPKAPHFWEQAGHLRSHMTNSCNLGKYRNMDVLEIVYMPDGVTPESITEYPALDFYCMSPACRARYNKSLHGIKNPR